MKTSLTVILIIQLYDLTSCAMKKHYFIDQQKTWNDALQYCRENYQNLSIFINGIEEQQFLQDAVGQTSDSWVGLWKISGIWVWITGEVPTQINWDNGEPDSDFCVFLDQGSKKLRDDSCSDTHTFFCMRVYEFEMVQQTESWEEALEYCRNHHDDLATLSTDRSMNYAVSKITGAQTQYVWIGLRFLAGEWFWISGVDLQYEVWTDATEAQCPVRNQRCAALNKNTQTWTPRDCQEKLNFLCSSRLN